MSTLKLRIEIEVVSRGSLVGTNQSAMVNDAIQELVNRRDFREGTLEQGRILTHRVDHESKTVNVDFYRMIVE